MSDFGVAELPVQQQFRPSEYHQLWSQQHILNFRASVSTQVAAVMAWAGSWVLPWSHQCTCFEHKLPGSGWSYSSRRCSNCLLLHNNVSLVTLDFLSHFTLDIFLHTTTDWLTAALTAETTTHWLLLCDIGIVFRDFKLKKINVTWKTRNRTFNSFTVVHCFR